MKLYSALPLCLEEYVSNVRLAREASNFDFLKDFVNQRKDAFVKDGIGHVYIKGMLLRDATNLDRALGCTDYADITADCETCILNGAKSILFHVDSGGGTVAGAIEAAEYLQNLSVPSVAYIDGMACSAAYKLISGVTYIVAAKSAQVGNIGAILVCSDTSKAYDVMGISFSAFTNDGASLKSTGHLPSLTDEQKQFLQDSINEAGDSFKSHVLGNRPTIDEEVFKAGWYSNAKAVALGLVDEVGNESLALEHAISLGTLFDTES